MFYSTKHTLALYQTHVQFKGLMLYSLCMKFQDELENRVLYQTFSSRLNSEVQPNEELKNAFE